MERFRAGRNSQFPGNPPPSAPNIPLDHAALSRPARIAQTDDDDDARSHAPRDGSTGGVWLPRPSAGVKAIEKEIASTAGRSTWVSISISCSPSLPTPKSPCLSSTSFPSLGIVLCATFLPIFSTPRLANKTQRVVSRQDGFPFPKTDAARQEESSSIA